MFLLLRDAKWDHVIGESSWVRPEPTGRALTMPFAPLRYRLTGEKNHTYQCLDRACGTCIAVMAWLLSVWEPGVVWGEETRAENIVTSVL